MTAREARTTAMRNMESSSFHELIRVRFLVSKTVQNAVSRGELSSQIQFDYVLPASVQELIAEELVADGYKIHFSKATVQNREKRSSTRFGEGFLSFVSVSVLDISW